MVIVLNWGTFFLRDRHEALQLADYHIEQYGVSQQKTTSSFKSMSNWSQADVLVFTNYYCGLFRLAKNSVDRVVDVHGAAGSTQGAKGVFPPKRPQPSKELKCWTTDESLLPELRPEYEGLAGLIIS